MMRKILLTCLLFTSMQAFALDFDKEIKGESNFFIFASEQTVASSLNFAHGFRDGKDSKGTYTYFSNRGEILTGQIQLTELEFNLQGRVHDDIDRLPDAGIELETCQFVILARWIANLNVTSSGTVGRLAWCYLKVPQDGENLVGIFWNSDSPDVSEFAGFWSGNLYN